MCSGKRRCVFLPQCLRRGGLLWWGKKRVSTERGVPEWVSSEAVLLFSGGHLNLGLAVLRQGNKSGLNWASNFDLVSSRSSVSYPAIPQHHNRNKQGATSQTLSICNIYSLGLLLQHMTYRLDTLDVCALCDSWAAELLLTRRNDLNCVCTVIADAQTSCCMLGNLVHWLKRCMNCSNCQPRVVSFSEVTILNVTDGFQLENKS